MKTPGDTDILRDLADPLSCIKRREIIHTILACQCGALFHQEIIEEKPIVRTEE